MSAAAKFCNFSHGYGVKKLDRHFPTNRRNTNRIQRVLRPSGTVGAQLATRNQLTCIRWTCRAEYMDSHHVELDTNGLTEEEKEEHISKATLIWRSIKLPFYTVACIPVTVGCAAAYLQTGEYFANRHVILLVSTFCVVSWANLSNDVYDFDNGADRSKNESVSGRTRIHIVPWLVLLLGFLGLLWVAAKSWSLHSVFLSACGVICGLLYQFPRCRLSYMGFGEPLVFAAFGAFATAISYWLQSGTRELSISRTIVSSSVLVGFTSSLILFCSHFHKVRLGTEVGANVVKVAIVGLYSLVLVLGLMESLPFSSFVLCALTLPMGRAVMSFIDKYHNDKEKISMATYYCMRLHTAFGLALSAGLVGARLFARKQLPHAIIL